MNRTAAASIKIAAIIAFCLFIMVRAFPPGDLSLFLNAVK
jgi:hypothetical protein